MFTVAQQRKPVEAPPHSRVFGLVVDGRGKPLADVVATLRLVDGSWAPGVEVPKVLWHGYEIEAFQTRSNSDGRFEFDVITPTADRVSLVLEPDIYHDLGTQDFGVAGGRDQRPFVVGDNRLGVFALAPTGAIAGRVLDEKHEPIAGAQVRLQNMFPGGMARRALTDASGAFTIEHVPARRVVIEALRDGYEIAQSPELDVAINATTASVDLVLAVAPTISGIVVDEQGNAIANARVWGWPEKSGTGSGATTDAQGKFTVALKQADAHHFEVEAEGFAKFAEPLFRSKMHPVGATDVRLVMKRAVMTMFVVIDGATSQPVTRYAVALERRPMSRGSSSDARPVCPLTEHSAGAFTCEADPDLFDYVITAPGYGVAKGQVSRESVASPRCVVKLAAEAVLRGRVTLDGKPVEDAEMLLYAASLLRYDQEDDHAGAFDEQDYFWSWEAPQSLMFVLPRPAKLRSGAGGKFSVGGLASGEYRLEIWSDGGSRKSLDPIAVAAGESLDLGDIELVPGSNLEGSVIVPDSVDPSTIQLSCWSMGRAVRAQVNADRTFRFEGAAAGDAHVLVDKAVGMVAWGKVPELVLAPGQTQRLRIDLRDQASVSGTVRVLVNGKPAQGVSVFLQSADGRGGTRMKDTDEAGLSTGSSTALGMANVSLRAPSGSPLGTFERQLDFSISAQPEATIEVSVGALELEWPALRVEEPLYLVQLASQIDGNNVALRAMSGFDSPRLDAHVTGKNTARFDWMLPGEHEWTIEVHTLEDRRVQHNHDFRRRFAIKAGETTRVELTERDRVQQQ